jgi:hypothetical protein
MGESSRAKEEARSEPDVEAGPESRDDLFWLVILIVTLIFVSTLIFGILGFEW